MLSWSRGLSDLSSSVPFADFVADYVFGLTTTGPSQSRAQGAPGKEGAEGAEGRSLPPRVASEDYWAGSPGSPCPAMTVRTVANAVDSDTSSINFAASGERVSAEEEVSRSIHEDLELYIPPPRRGRFLRDLRFVRQERTWDCGLACALMALRMLGDVDVTLESLAMSCGTESVWTIDLAVLLHQRGARVDLLTTSAGVSADYDTVPFYQNAISSDRKRVQQLFAGCSRGAGLRVHIRHLEPSELMDLVLGGRHVVIALVDKSVLSHCEEETARLRTEAGLTGYVGHYLVVAGADADRGTFWVADPSVPGGPIEVPGSELEAARTAFGTDEDLLLVSVPESMPESVPEA